jgi:hypothetical protein
VSFTPARVSATYVFNLHGDLASMCYVVTLLHARVSFLLAAYSVFFPRYTCELERFLLACAELPHVAFNIFLPALERTCFSLHVRSAFFYLRYVACLCWSKLERTRLEKPGVSRVILPSRAGRVIWFF